MSQPSTKAWRALLWKELREAAMPGIAALAIVAVAQAYGLTRDQQFAALEGSAWSPSDGASLFTLVSAGVALLIAGAQLFRERRGDMAAFLIHRPVPRTTIFWCKALAGIAWYVIAAGLPLMASYVWLTLPGRSVGPFVPSMMLPAIADLLCGFVYYFAAMVVVMRFARWYASAMLPIGAAIACSMLEMNAGTFGGAAVRIAACLVVMAVAARSVFVAGGRLEPQRRLGRSALGLSVGAGVVLASVIPLAALLVGVVRKPAPAKHGDASSAYSETSLAADGQLVRATWKSDIDGRTLVDVRGLDGRPLDALADSVRLWKRTDVGVISTDDIPLQLDGDYPEVHRRGYRGVEDVFALLRYPRAGLTSWYYMRRVRLIDVRKNYDPGAGHTGWLGPDGYSPGPRMPAHRFAGDLVPRLGDQRLLAFPNAVYRLDFDSRSIVKVFTAPPGEQVVGAASSGDSTATILDGPRAQFDAIATTRRIYVQARDGTRQRVVPREAAASGYGRVIVSRAMLACGRDTYLTYFTRGGTLPAEVADTASTRYVGYRDDGSIVARATPLKTPLAVQVEPIQWAQIVIGAVIEPAVWRANVSFTQNDNPAKRARREEPAPRIVGWVVAVAGSIGWVCVVLIAGRRYAFSKGRTITWSVLAIAFGPFAVALMYSLLDLPARQLCPACRKKRVVTRERCEHCGAPFAPPPRDGTELIEMELELVG